MRNPCQPSVSARRASAVGQSLPATNATSSLCILYSVLIIRLLSSLRGLRHAFCIGICPLLIIGPSWSAEPTLARLSFFIPSERRSEFEATYRSKALPVLAAHGLHESATEGRAVPDSIFSRLFEFPTVQDYRTARDRLNETPAWGTVLTELGSQFRSGSGDTIRHALSLYRAPAGPGKPVNVTVDSLVWEADAETGRPTM